MIAFTQQQETLAITAMRISQKGAGVEIIRQIALISKMAGVALYQIGDTGFRRVALPENLLAYSGAIRGVRHTHTGMARFINSKVLD